jgi:3-deoxy-D-manno-octulosonate 8-phosphate phosphatase (KDO 8-P phosphatase)
MDNNLMQKAAKPPVNWQDIQLVIFDCDGVLTDGKIIYCDRDYGGTNEAKHFNAHDGMGFALLHRAGLIPAVITGRTSQALAKRCKDLSIKYLYQSVQNKLEKAYKLISKLGLSWSQVVYMGDDWNDVPCMQAAAFSVCPCDALPQIRLLADFTTEHIAGDGAARDCIDYILHKKGLYEQAVVQYLQEIS